VDLSLRLFQEGQTDFLSVLTAERTLYTDDSAFTQSGENIATDLIALYKALDSEVVGKRRWPSESATQIVGKLCICQRGSAGPSQRIRGVASRTA
jgi:hypothetical protein